jgi:glutaredoxin 3
MIQVYTTQYCGYCTAAKRLLTQLGLLFEEIPLDGKPELRERLSKENHGYRTVPMIFIDGEFIGGYTDLAERHSQGLLKVAK